MEFRYVGPAETIDGDSLPITIFNRIPLVATRRRTTFLLEEWLDSNGNNQADQTGFSCSVRPVPGSAAKHRVRTYGQYFLADRGEENMDHRTSVGASDPLLWTE